MTLGRCLWLPQILLPSLLVEKRWLGLSEFVVAEVEEVERLAAAVFVVVVAGLEHAVLVVVAELLFAADVDVDEFAVAFYFAFAGHSALSVVVDVVAAAVKKLELKREKERSHLELAPAEAHSPKVPTGPQRFVRPVAAVRGSDKDHAAFWRLGHPAP